MEVKQVALSELRNWKDNPRAIKQDRFEELKQRLLDEGEFKPLIVTPDGEVLGGNMRLRAMRELGWDKAWVSVVHPKNEAHKIKIALTDNEEMGYYEDQALAELIDKYKAEIDISKYKVHLNDPISLEELLQKFSPEPEEDEFDATLPEEPISVLGEVYQLGRHRVMCGDSTKIEDVEKLMDGQKADMVFTDPPYGIAYKDTKGKFNDIENDGDLETAKQLVKDSLSLVFGVPTYVCCNWKSSKDIAEAMESIGLSVKSCIVWDKGTRIQNLDKYFKQHEFILYSGPFGGEKTVDGDVWNISRETRDDHPTAKPIELCARAINHNGGKNVVDLFLGSGSTLIACEQTNRTCYGMEIDPKYVDVIRKRYAKFIGKEDTWEEVTPVIGK